MGGVRTGYKGCQVELEEVTLEQLEQIFKDYLIVQQYMREGQEGQTGKKSSDGGQCKVEDDHEEEEDDEFDDFQEAKPKETTPAKNHQEYADFNWDLLSGRNSPPKTVPHKTSDIANQADKEGIREDNKRGK